MANSADPDQLASKKPTDLDLNCLQRQDISGLSRTRVKNVCCGHSLEGPCQVSKISGTTKNKQTKNSIFNDTDTFVQKMYKSRGMISFLLLLLSTIVIKFQEVLIVFIRVQ